MSQPSTVSLGISGCVWDIEYCILWISLGCLWTILWRIWLKTCWILGILGLEFGILDMLGIFGAQWLNSFVVIGICRDVFLFTSCEKWPNSKMKLVQRRVLHEPVCCPSNFQRYDEVWLWLVNLGTSRHSGNGEKVQSRGWFGNEILDFELMQKVGLFVNASCSRLSNKQNT